MNSSAAAGKSERDGKATEITAVAHTSLRLLQRGLLESWTVSLLSPATAETVFGAAAKGTLHGRAGPEYSTHSEASSNRIESTSTAPLTPLSGRTVDKGVRTGGFGETMDLGFWREEALSRGILLLQYRRALGTGQAGVVATNAPCLCLVTCRS